MVSALQTFYDRWAEHQQRLVDTVRELTPEQLALRTAPDMWAVWQLASHMAGARAHWFHQVLLEGSPSVGEMFRVPSTTVPGLPLEDAGWEDDETQPRDAAEIVTAFEVTWALIADCLRRWTADDLAVELPRHRPSGTRIVSRQWVIWQVATHDFHHGGEISQILGSHGAGGLGF